MITKFIIKPFIGVNDIRFGMTSEEISTLLGKTPRRFRKSLISKSLTDAYEYCHVYFDKEGACEAIEFFEPAIVQYENHEPLGMSYETFEKAIRVNDLDIDCDGAGFASYKLGVGVYAPSASDEPKEAIESVIVFRQGYYD